MGKETTPEASSFLCAGELNNSCGSSFLVLQLPDRDEASDPAVWF